MLTIEALLMEYQQTVDGGLENELIGSRAISLIEHTGKPMCTYEEAYKIYMVLRFNQDPYLDDARSALCEKIKTFEQAVLTYLNTGSVKMEVNGVDRGECLPDRTLQRRAAYKAKNRAVSLTDKIYLYAAAEKLCDIILSVQVQQSILREGTETNSLQSIYFQSFLLKLGKLKREVHNTMMSSPKEQERLRAYAAALEWGKELLSDAREQLSRSIKSYSTATTAYMTAAGLHDEEFLPSIRQKIAMYAQTFKEWNEAYFFGSTFKDTSLCEVAAIGIISHLTDYAEALTFYKREEKDSPLSVHLKNMIVNGTESVPELMYAHQLAVSKSDLKLASQLKEGIYIKASPEELYHFFHASKFGYNLMSEVIQVICTKLSFIY